jgi:phage protein D
MAFSRNALYYDGAVRVIGFDEANKKSLVAEEKVKGDPKQQTVISEPQPTVTTDPDAYELDQAKKRAKAEGNRNKQKSQGGRGTCVGLPEIVPGRFIQLKKLDKDIDGTYYIKSVNHNLGADGFTTNFSIGGWK